MSQTITARVVRAKISGSRKQRFCIRSVFTGPLLELVMLCNISFFENLQNTADECKDTSYFSMLLISIVKCSDVLSNDYKKPLSRPPKFAFFRFPLYVLCSCESYRFNICNVKLPL